MIDISSFFSPFSICNRKRLGKGGNKLSSTMVISIMVGLIILLLFIGAPIKPTRFIANSVIKLGIGVLLLFFFNVFGGAIGLHIPINIFTVFISGFLGVLGISSLAAIQIFLI